MALRTDQFIPPVLAQRYEQIAATLESEIRAGALSPGDRLPSERDLAQRMGVSRATVREALGALQLAGLVETRQGAGSFVAAVPPQRPLADVTADASPSAVLEARAIVEPAILSRAAKAGRTNGATAELLEVMAGSSDPADPEQRQRWSDADREFHRQFAYATGNPVLITFADHLAGLMDQPLWRRLRDDSISVPGRTALQLAEHRLIAAAVAEGDAEAAARHATQHINRARRYMALAD
jgi:DNA-binding FadR family transcriptional regulator